MCALVLKLKSIMRLVDPSVREIDDMSTFLAVLGVPQVTAVLIAEDYNCSLAAGAHMAWLSEPYGRREFSLDLSEPTLLHLLGRCEQLPYPQELKLWEKDGVSCFRSTPPVKAVRQRADRHTIRRNRSARRSESQEDRPSIPTS